MYDAIIVGAGPVGLYAASLLEKRLEVLVIEGGKGTGGKACSGLYSTRLGDFVQIQEGWVKNRVRKAVMHSPSGNELKLEKRGTAAYVVDRDRFTKHLARSVKSRVLFGARVRRIESGPDRMAVVTSKGRFESRVLLGCDGANSVVRRHFCVKPKEFVNGLIAITKERDSSDHVDMYFDKGALSDGFFWRIPRGETTEYGAFGKKATFKQLERFFGLKRYDKRAAVIPTGPCKTYFNRTLLIGDAAGITKPWSFGGVIYGFLCARIASRVIFQAFRQKDFSEGFLKAYEKGWKKSIGRTIMMGMVMRAVFKRMSNRHIDILFSKFGGKRFLNRMDMDFPSLL
jgi:geranylgeranyl reductase family protein